MKIKKLILPIIIAITAFFFIQKIAKSNKPEPDTTPPNLAQSRSIWPQEQSNLPPDPAITWGKLNNGFRYAIMPNDEPPGQVSLKLYVDAGSLMEDEDQRGLAHFLEHMSFKGGKYFPTQEALNHYFEHIGMGFGADTNAHTGLDETVYKIDLPKNTEEYLRDGFKVISDFANGLLLNQSDIDSERGVILSEKRDHYTVGERIRDAFYAFTFPGTIIPDRMPIGIEEVIQNANRDRFLRFYQDWYNTNRMILVIAGSVDPSKIPPLLQEYFGSIKPLENPKPDPDLGELKPYTSPVKIHIEKETTSTDLEYFTVHPHKPYKDSLELRINNIQRYIAYQILNKRLELISKTENTPFTSPSAGRIDLFHAFEIPYVNVTPKENMWAESIPIIEQELRRALQYGFTEAEMNEAKANTLNAFEQAVLSAPKRKSRSLTSLIVSELSDKRVFTSPEEDLKNAKLAINDLTLQKALELFKKDWENQQPLIFISGDANLKATEALILDAYNKSKEKPVEAPKHEETPEFAYKNFGEPGKIIDQGHYPTSDIDYYRFANGVRLNLKKTDFESDNIYIIVEFGLGLLDEPTDKRGLGSLASAIFIDGGLQKHATTEIDRIFAGKTMSSSFHINADSFVISGATNKRDLPEEMNLLAALLTNPGYRDEAFRLAKINFEEYYKGLELTPEAVLGNHVDKFLAGGSDRFGAPDKDKFFALTTEDVKNWLSSPLNSGYIEISVVGDFNKEEVIKAVAKTFGALPTRTATKEQLFQPIPLKFPAGGTKKTFELTSEFEKALSLVYWPTTDFWNIETNRKLTVLAEIFSDRLINELRIKLGETYSPHASNTSSPTDKNYGRFVAMAGVRIEQADQAVDIISQIGKDLYEKGATQDEFERAIKPILRQLELVQRSNSYWLNVLKGSQVRPELITFAENRKEMYESFTLEDINKIAKEFLKPENAVTITIIAKKELEKEIETQ